MGKLLSLAVAMAGVAALSAAPTPEIRLAMLAPASGSGSPLVEAGTLLLLATGLFGTALLVRRRR